MESNLLPINDIGHTAETEEFNKYLLFSVADTHFSIEISEIKEIIEFSKVTRVPMSPRCIKGVFNLRGTIIPIIDLAFRLGKEPNTETRRSCIIVTEVIDDDQRVTVGFSVDSVERVVDIASRLIESPPPFGADIRLEFISGIARIEAGLITCLNLDELLSVSELCDSSGASL